MKTVVCEFIKTIYPPDITNADENSFTIALYRPCERIRDAAGNTVTQVKAVGYCLPLGKKLRYDIQGHWSKNPKHGFQFEVESYSEVIVPTREGIIAYLSSGQIKGIGPKLAERIYDAFGTKTLEVLDKDPEQLLAIPRISERKLEKIRDSYLANRGARDIVTFLAPHGITPNRAIRLYWEYGDQAMDIVRNHPYQLCEMVGIGFSTADKIAMSMGIDPLSPERVDEGILYTLTEAEGKGHLCIQKQAFLKACLKTLSTPQLTEQMVGNRATRLVYDGRLVIYGDQVYRAKTAEAEDNLARAICYQAEHQKSYSYGNLDAELDQEEQLLHIRLDPEQRKAVKMALTHGLSIITGGPGTGKTMIQKALLDIYQKKHPDDEIVCCAPTGRAARRMEQSTGHPASTVHKALGLTAADDGSENSAEMLDADLILVDEVSMLDIYLAAYLFDSLKAGSRIAVNAKRIRHGEQSLEYGPDFQMIESADLERSAEIIESLYLQETAAYGVDNVALLTPYRQKTATGVNALNPRLRALINPPDAGKQEVSAGQRIFRVGDKVMQTKNNDEVNNGDIGYITGITHSGGDTTVRLDFGDAGMLEYDAGDLDALDLGYAFTVHKSQGSEYPSVIINLQRAHSIMLTRPLIYTAITRGKAKVTIVGERRALYTAIRRTDTEKRGTQLAARIREYKK